MKYLSILALLCFPLLGNSQLEKEIILSDSTEMMFVSRSEKVPIHISGDNDNLISALYNSLSYPKSKCISGTTFLTFKIDTSGNVLEPKIFRSLDILIDQQLLKEIYNHTFVPGEFYDKKVQTSMTIPIRIGLTK